MKTSELTGALLDYWAGLAEGWRVVNDFGGPCWANVKTKTEYVAAWKPSTTGALGGPIIERERIDLTAPDDGATDWWAYCWDERLQENWMGHGETPLIAAMRAFCGAKFGHEVPDSHEAAINPTK